MRDGERGKTVFRDIESLDNVKVLKRESSAG